MPAPYVYEGTEYSKGPPILKLADLAHQVDSGRPVIWGRSGSRMSIRSPGWVMDNSMVGLRSELREGAFWYAIKDRPGRPRALVPDDIPF